MQDIQSVEARVNNVLLEVKSIIEDVIVLRKNSPENKEKTAKIFRRNLSIF